MIVKSITQWFVQPTAASHARRELERHQRELIRAKQSRQFAASVVTYHESTILDLKKTLAELGEK